MIKQCSYPDCLNEFEANYGKSKYCSYHRIIRRREQHREHEKRMYWSRKKEQANDPCNPKIAKRRRVVTKHPVDKFNPIIIQFVVTIDHDGNKRCGRCGGFLLMERINKEEFGIRCFNCGQTITCSIIPNTQNIDPMENNSERVQINNSQQESQEDI